MLKKVKLDDAIGLVLAHDVTKVIPGKFKGPLFSRGHVIAEQDITELRNIGKDHVYIMELDEGEVHEEEAAIRIAKAVAGAGLEFTQPKEGRVNLKASNAGLLRINVEALRRINAIGDIVLVTRHDHTYCPAGSVVAGMKIVPLFVAKEQLEQLDAICGGAGPVITLLPLQKKTIGVVITGNEVYSGRIKDGFGDYIRAMAAKWGSEVGATKIVPDDEAMIAAAVNEVKAQGSEVIIVCGGLSVDPDDVTVDGVKQSGATILSYGAPVMPGVMFLLAELGGVPILGAPSAVLNNPATILDIILPRILAGERVSRDDILDLGHGGLCLNCATCTFPVCPFGK